MNNKVEWAVIPAAGRGTRFLPITKGTSKEMLNIIDRPTIDYIVDELIDSGIKNIVFVISLNKDEIMMVGDTYYDALAGINADVQTSLMTMRYRVNLDSILDKVTLKAKSYDDLVNFIKLTNDLK